MNTHTPGPWTAIPRADLAENGNVIVESSCEVICHVFNDNNAPLIAKAPIAPKLAEALRDLLDKMETPRTTKASTAWDNARAAIAEWDKEA